MKMIYASRSGNVEKIVNELGFEATKILTGEEMIHEPYILFTYTDGVGMIPKKVEAFLNNNASLMKGVVVSGSTLRHHDTFGFAGDKIAQMYDVPLLCKLDGVGTSQELDELKQMILAMND